jgi:urease accessory protein
MRRIVDIVRETTLADDSVRLDQDMRTRRRMVYLTVGGAAILLDRPQAVRLRDGDGLVLDDGTIVRVDAAPEPLIEIEAADTAALVRIAWHLGNRHLPTQLLGAKLRIRADHVIAEMVTGLGGRCTSIEAPFDPEGGAYAGDGGATILHAHDHSHGAGHGHSHAHGHHHHHDHG